MIKPLFSEKSIDKVEKFNEYTFLVDPGMTKYQIAKYIQDMFGFKPLTVNTKTKRSKLKRSAKNHKKSFSAQLKYAVVKLREKEKIDIFEVKENKKGK